MELAQSIASRTTRALTRSTKVTVPLEFGAEHGHQIFVYTHLLTRRVIYSLSRSMRNKLALEQLTFVGKKSVPRALRKDHWTPLCVLSFPNPSQGLHAYARLREFRNLHETAWPLETMTQKEGKTAGQLLTKKEKSRKLQDQKANSVADMAAVLAMQARPPNKGDIQRAKFFVRTDGRPPAKRGFGSRRGHNVFEFQGRIMGTSIWWADMLDAEFAATWPEEVVHGRLAVNRGTAIWPPPEELASKEYEVQTSGRGEGAYEEAVLKAKEDRESLLNRRDELSIGKKIKDAEARAVNAPATEGEERAADAEEVSRTNQQTARRFASSRRAWLRPFGVHSGPVPQQSSSSA